jgi:hypothetical protein
MAFVPMLILLSAKFPVSQPVKVQRDYALQGEIDAPLLFILYALSFLADMAGHIKNGRNRAMETVGFVEDRH